MNSNVLSYRRSMSVSHPIVPRIKADDKVLKCTLYSHSRVDTEADEKRYHARSNPVKKPNAYWT